MKSRKNCVYCNKEITTRSREHVIQNALGGLYESEDICCPECNNYVSKHIDAPFTKIFNPVVGNIDNLAKSHNKNSTPAYTGIISYDSKQYEASIKAGKVVSCPTLSRELRCDISKLPLKIESYKFDLDNQVFHTGIAKIAFNYALAANIDFQHLQSGLNVTRSGNDVSKIEYNYPIVPFMPMNPLDTVLELGTPTELFHNMILFTQSNQLWCYVDLFNTFQYYVLLCDNFPTDTGVYQNYAQTLKRIPRPEDLEIFSPKDAMIYAQQYGVEPTMDKAELAMRIKNAGLNKTSLDKLISKKMLHMSPLDLMQTLPNPVQFLQTMPVYFDNEDGLIKETFRIWTPSPDEHGLMFYPDTIMQVTQTDKKPLTQYTMTKFKKLNELLISKTK